MKRKELIQLVIAVVILVAAGSLIFSQLSPKKSAASQAKPTYQVITPVKTDYDSSALSMIKDTTKTRDFYQTPNFSGLGNTSPFSGR